MSKLLGKQLVDNIDLPGTGGVLIPSGTTAQRKTGSNGNVRLNTELQKIEALIQGSWKQLGFDQQDLAAIQLRRTTTQALTTTQVDITLDSIDYNNQPSVLNRNAVTSRLDVLVSGVYLVIINGESINTTNANRDLFSIKVDGSPIPGGLVEINCRSSRESFSKILPVYIANGSYISVSAYSNTGNTGTLQAGFTLNAVRLQGAQGPAGVPGSLINSVIHAAQFDTPNSVDWAVNASAPAIADSVNSALLVRAFDDTAEEGVGCTVQIPPGVSNLTLTIVGRAATAPATSKVVVPRLFGRKININAALSSWTGLVLNSFNVPNNAYFQTYSQTIPLSSLGCTEGSAAQFEFTRQGSNASDNLVGDFLLLNATLSFS